MRDPTQIYRHFHPKAVRFGSRERARVPVRERSSLQRFHKSGTISVKLESLRAKRRPSELGPDITIEAVYIEFKDRSPASIAS